MFIRAAPSRVAIWALAPALAFGVACPPEDECTYGVSPFDGQTAVPVDVVIEFRASHPLPPDLPALSDVVWLERVADGRRVDVDITFDGVVRLTPVAPLEADTEYEAVGIYGDDLGPHSAARLRDEPTAARFSTESDPHVRYAARYPQDRVAVVFSEPMVPETVRDGVSVLDSGGASVGSYLGLRGNRPNQFEFAVAEGVEAVTVDVAAGVEASTGVSLQRSVSEEVRWDPYGTELAGFDGLARCVED